MVKLINVARHAISCLTGRIIFTRHSRVTELEDKYYVLGLKLNVTVHNLGLIPCEATFQLFRAAEIIPRRARVAVR
jgi:hypothetical protein